MAADTPWPRASQAWYATFVLMVAYTLSYIDRQILSMLVDPIKADLQITDTQIGLLQGFAFAVFYTLVGVPMGRLADRGERRRIIAWGIFFWSLATACCGLAKNFWQLFLARVGVGVGEAALGPAAYSMIADYFPPEQRGRALGVYSMGVYLGIGLAAIIGGFVVGALAEQPALQLPWIGELAAWHLTFLVVGVPGLLVALWAATLREPVRRGANANANANANATAINTEAPRFRDAITFLRLHRRFFTAHFLGFSLLTLAFNAIVFWMAPYLVRVHQLTPAEFGTTLGFMLALGGATGILSGGAFADWLRRRGVSSAELWPGVVSGIAVAPLGIATAQASDGNAALAIFTGFMFFSSFAFAAAASALQAVTPNRLRGQVSALYLFFVNLAGIGVGTFLTGWINDHIYADPLRVNDSMSWIVGIAAPLAALLLLGGMRSYRNMQETAT